MWMKEKKLAQTIKTKLVRLFRKTIAVIVFLSLWEIAPRFRLGGINPMFVPPFSTVIRTLWGIIVSGELGMHVLTSLRRALIGFLSGCAFAVPLGLAIGWFKRLGDIISPLFQTFRNIPTLALLPVFVALFGISETSSLPGCGSGRRSRCSYSSPPR
jgi:NitT/TauT family transport system permease protein